MRWTPWILAAAIVAGFVGPAAGWQPGCPGCNGGMAGEPAGQWALGCDACCRAWRLLPGPRLLRVPAALLRQLLGRLLRAPGAGRGVLGPSRCAQAPLSAGRLLGGTDGALSGLSAAGHVGDACDVASACGPPGAEA